MVVPEKVVTCLVPGLVLAAVIAAASRKRILVRVGRLPLCSPNWVTSWSLVLFWIGVVTYLSGSLLCGFLFLAIGSVLDHVDGKMAAALEKAGVPRSARDAHIGAWLDPLVDKLRLLPFIGILSLRGTIEPWIACAVISVDIVGTLMREPFNFGNGRMRTSRATGIGKLKSIVQMLGCLVGMSYELGWAMMKNAPDIILAFALVLGILSILSRMRINATVDALVDNFGTFFRHQDV
jgi:phosphatidylglycerophosphate synthase